MGFNIDYFRAIQNTIGVDSEPEALASESKAQIAASMRDSIGYVKDAKRNGVRQELVLSIADSYYKAHIIALPGDDLFPGDLLCINDQYWIVVNTRQTNPIQTVGVAWLCNHKFRWQNFSQRIIECWGVLDSGVYSTTKKDETRASLLNKQFKIYLPYNNDTSKIFIDKRFAISRRYNSDGDVVLETYKVTSYDPLSSSYGLFGHLLVMAVESDVYCKDVDSIPNMVCDYISNVVVNAFAISGNETIRVGKTRTYTVSESLTGNVTWSVATDAVSGITYTTDDVSLTLSADDSDELIGHTATVTATASGKSASKTVRVVAYG